MKIALWLAAAAVSVWGLNVFMGFVCSMNNQEYYFYSDRFLNAVDTQFALALNHIDGAQAGGTQDGICYYAVAGGRVYTDADAGALTEIQNALTTPPGTAGQALEQAPLEGDTDGPTAAAGQAQAADVLTGAAENGEEAPAPIPGVTVQTATGELPLYSPLDYPWQQLMRGESNSLYGSVFIAAPDGLAHLEGSTWDYADQEVSNLLDSRLARADVPDFDFILVYQSAVEGRATQAAYDAEYQQDLLDGYFLPGLLLLAGLGAVCLWLAVLAGRNAADSPGAPVHLVFLDHCPAEVLAAGIAALGLATAFLVNVLARFSYADSQGRALPAGAAPLAQGLVRLALPVALGFVMLALALSLVRQAKAHVLWRHSVCGRIAAPLITGRAYLKHCPPAARMARRIPAVFVGCMALWLVLWLASGLFNLLFLPGTDAAVLLLLGLVTGCAVALGGIVYLYRVQLQDSRGVAALMEQVQAAAGGEAAGLNLPQDNAFYEACAAARQVGRNVQENVDARLKSERMKLDLITNVSHDLKTPLTSIIGYVDLLEKQELGDEAADYVKILRKKADRLSDTVQDLFTLAKSTSGSEPTPLERRDLVMAVKQVMADMADTLAGAPAVRTNLPDTAPVLAESGKLYRVLQNLLDNAARYSLAGTRIYLSVDAGPKATVLTVKNTAGYEMDFTAEEILQRFARGDKSRTGEGSGLGLSIAESFMRNFGGDFSVTVDGDQFAARCTFQTAPEADASRETPESGREPAGEDGGEAP